MNKKSAIATAGGLVASFAAGVAAVSFNWGLGVPTATSAAATTAAASPSPQKQHVKPIIRHRTITVHKKAPAPKPAQHTVALSAAPPVYQPAVAPVTHSSGSHAGGGESEGGDHEGGGD